MNTAALTVETQEVRVRGTVQGVGFRPTVYRLAKECQLNGEVFNDADGVLIRLSGRPDELLLFLDRLKSEAPPLSKIDAVEVHRVSDDWQYDTFSISHSSAGVGNTEITADAACCQACLDEVFDPDERRYLYPFTNCTHCGPRLSIVQGIPYDRCNTTMEKFPLCDSCSAEYQDPLDRRFHAQPVACHECGPKLTLHRKEKGAIVLCTTVGNQEEQSYQHLQLINQSLLAGQIVAIKGLGGFHLCCDATNHRAVSQLRARKQRYAKPFALMSHDLKNIARYCHLSTLEEETMRSPAAPIVLLEQKPTGTVPALSNAIAPGSSLLGFMLPYTPLHSLISRRFDKPLVMTSGNLSGEPQIIDNQEAIKRLGAIADLIVCHNRDIASRIDDSVVRCVAGRARIMRRARGYAPRSIVLPEGFEKADGILAYGAELKSTFCIVQQGAAVLSQHQGDLEDLRTFEDFETNLALFKRLFEFEPRYLAYDKHPEYLSSKLAKSDAEQLQLAPIGVQHHHAHIASAMAENQLPKNHPRVLGIALDGLGFGEDGSLWGGEFLLADYSDFIRLASFTPVAMPGGAMAIKQPWRNSFAHILNSMTWQDFTKRYADIELAELFRNKPIETLRAMLTKGLNCPTVSSVGRLFDAVAAATGLSAEAVQFEGQAAIELEMLVDARAVFTGQIQNPYVLTIEGQADQANASCIRINPGSIWPALLNDLKHKVDKSIIATRFHAGLITALVEVVDLLAGQFTFSEVVLSGGCMQNRILLEGLERQLHRCRFNCLSHSLVPANDGGIALGQAVIAAAKISNQELNHQQFIRP